MPFTFRSSQSKHANICTTFGVLGLIMKFDNLITPDFSSFINLIFFTVTIIIIKLYTSRLKKWKYILPPGPSGAPLLGNLVQMVKDPHLKFSQWAKQYGKLYTITMANRQALVISDATLLRELLGMTASTGRFKTDTTLLLSQGSYGLFNTDGSVWAEQRQFCLRNLRQLGYGQSMSMEPLILHEVHELCEWIRKASNNNLTGIVDLTHVLNQSAVNALWTIITGERFCLEDGNSNTLWIDWVNAMQTTMKTGLGFFPWLKYVAPKLSGYLEMDTACKNIHAFIGAKFEEHKLSNVNRQRRDLLDAYIDHMNKINGSGGGDKEQESSFFGVTGWKNSLASVAELFAGGGETTATTLKWAAVYLSHNLEVQRKLQQEIDDVIGRDVDPSLSDKTRMPYTEAVILETLRLSSIAIFGGPHELLEDISFQGYTLPKGMILMPNLYHIHHNPEIWGDPEVFRPERFLTDEGQMLKDNLVPFQAGKRQCLGEQLAKDVLFLFVVKLFQQFTFKPDTSVSKDTYFKPDVGILLLPKCTKFAINSR